MAAVKESTGVFSYAQAAKGRTQSTPSQAQSSKATSGAATPASGKMAELAPGSSWADDVEASVAERASSLQKPIEQSKPAQKDGSAPQQSSDEHTQNGVSDVSSPDLGATSNWTTKNEDVLAQNPASSEYTSESKPSALDSSWITDREKRQNTTKPTEELVVTEEMPKKQQSSMRLELYEAAPPAVNPWAARMQASAAKVTTQPLPPRSSSSVAPAESGVSSENQRPRADSRRKANSVAGLPRGSDFTLNMSKETKKPLSYPGKKPDEVRISNSAPTSKAEGETAPEAVRRGAARSTNSERPSLPNAVTAPPPVRDETSWPTPDSIQERERKKMQEKEPSEKDESGTSTAKPHGKTEWKVLPVVPNVVFASQDQIRGPRPPGTGTRGRGGNSMRGRGGYHGQNGNGNSERQSGPASNAPNSDENTGAPKRGRSDVPNTDREAMVPPPKPNRASSAGSLREQRKPEAHRERTPRMSSVGDAASGAKAAAEAAQAEGKKDSAPQVAAYIPHYSEIRPVRLPMRRSVAPNGVQDEQPTPDPVLRRNSVGTQTEESPGTAESSVRDGPPVRTVPSENRKEARFFDSYRDPNWNGAFRGKGRGSRGRGGSREFTNGHPANQSFNNGSPAEYANSSAYNVPQSPSTYGPQRGGHQTSYSQQGRNGWRGAGPRSQSIPIESYGRYAGQFGAPPQQPHQLQTYYPGMYDYSGAPMTATPWQPYMDPIHLPDMVSTQVEYYFSMDNMLKDMFLRKNMDSQGYVFLGVIANFNRIKQLTTDLDLIRSVCLASDNIEIRVGDDGRERLRKRHGWEQFVLLVAERHADAQNDGPARVDPPVLQMPVFGQPQMMARAPASAVMPPTYTHPDRRSQDLTPSTMNGGPMPGFFSGMPDSDFGDVLNGDELRGRQAKSPIHEKSVSSPHQSLASSTGEHDGEPDNFSDAQIEALMVLVKPDAGRMPHTPYNSAASRTFSNGSIDCRSIASETQGSDDKSPRPIANGDRPVTNGNDSRETSAHQSPNDSHPANGFTITTPPPLFWMKDKEAPVDSVPPNSGHERYILLRLKALDQRLQASTGNCPYDMKVLYQLWSHFLVRNFNTQMYLEFHRLATEDANVRHSMTGMENLFKYYGEVLHSQNSIRDRVARDYVKLVKSEQPKGEGAAFKQLRAAWRNGELNLKNRKKMNDVIDDALKAELDQS